MPLAALRGTNAQFIARFLKRHATGTPLCPAPYAGAGGSDSTASIALGSSTPGIRFQSERNSPSRALSGMPGMCAKKSPASQALPHSTTWALYEFNPLLGRICRGCRAEEEEEEEDHTPRAWG